MTRLKKISIRKQLALLYSVILFVVCIILFTTFYLLTKNYLVFEIDRSLSIHAAQIAYSVSTDTNNLHDMQTKNILALSQKEVHGIFVDVIDTQGNNIDGNKSDFQNLALDAMKKGIPTYAQTVISDFNMRIIAYPVKNGDQTIGTVIMGHPTDVYEKTLSQLRNVGIILILFLVFPSILIGYFLAKSATEPITKLGADISRITTENLSKRVDVTAKTEETEILINNFNSLLERLSKAFNLERQFLGETAHEIKTPLTVIKSNGEVTLSKERTVEEYKVSIKQTLTQINKLSKNMESLMDFAWTQNGDLSKNFSSLNLSQLMRELSSVAEYAALPKKITIETDIVGNVSVLGKEEKLYQAVYNIIDNAIKFTPSHGKILISLNKQAEKAIIKIKDSGIGIPLKLQKEIFNRFYRTEQNKNIAGHGLGLAITDSIIKAHAGQIAVESLEDRGSTFTVTLKAI